MKMCDLSLHLVLAIAASRNESLRIVLSRISLQGPMPSTLSPKPDPLSLQFNAVARREQQRHMEKMQPENWENFVAYLQEHLRTDQYNIWLKTLVNRGLDGNRLVLEVANDHYKQWISQHFLEVLHAAAFASLGQEVAIDLVVQPSLKEQPSLPWAEDDGSDLAQSDARPPSGTAHLRASSHASVDRSLRSHLNPDYTFDNFVVGGSNEFAHAAARGVAERPAESYNPLFIYGGVGLGKTHLIHAIGNAVVANTGLRVCYLSSEQFMNELITGIERKEMHSFRERYRTQCDVLLIDDIQFIAGKERTQEEFFHTFNALYNNLKQIILTSDKSPQEIPRLEERLQSRFNWGLLADIQAPDLETKVAILNKKAAREGLALPHEVGVYIARQIVTNIRELEGCLKRVTARAKLNNEPLTLSLAESVIEPFLKQRISQLTPDRIIKTVCSYFNVSAKDILGRVRTKPIAYPRQIAMYLARQHTNLSFPDLGRTFCKDHTTVLNACQRIKSALDDREDPAIKADVDAIERILLN